MRRLGIPRRLSGCYQQVVKICAVVFTLAIVSTPAFGQSVPTTSPLKIGIIGSGNIGSTLGEFWAKAGHQI